MSTFNRLALAAGAVFLVSAGGPGGVSARAPIQQPRIEYLQLFGVLGPIDCGQFYVSAGQRALEQAIDCGLSASARRQSFQTMLDKGFEMDGLFGTTAGAVYQFTYRGSFAVRRCPKPTAGRLGFECLLPANRTGTVQRPREYIEQIIGPGAALCGEHGIAASAEALRESMICAKNATERRQPFHTIKQYQGTDSLVFEGLFGTSSGQLFKFSYDSGPCGNRTCFGSFTIEPCMDVSVIEQPYPRYSCSRRPTRGIRKGAA